MLSKKIIWKLNIIDLLLLAIIVLSVAALIYKTAWGKKYNDYQEYTIAYVCESTPIELVNKIQEGELCIDNTYGSEIGVVNSIEYTPITEVLPPNYYSTAENTDESDEESNRTPRPRPTPEPTRAKIRFLAEANGAQTDHGIRIDQNIYLIGQSTQIIIGNTIFDVYISDIY